MRKSGAEKRLTREDLMEAAKLRFIDGLSWGRIAQIVGTSEKTLWNWRNKGEPWNTIKAETVEELKAQATPTAYGCLIRQAAKGDVAAAKELLARAEGAVPTKTELTGAGGGPVQTQVGLTPESLALMRQREAEDNGSTGD